MNPNKSIRIKITGACNRQCSFCHKEGDMKNIENIVFDNELEGVINKLSSDFNINRVALTGGEPFLHSDILNLAKNIHTRTRIKNISITTNGTIPVHYSLWKELKDNGLTKVSISISDILNYVTNSNETAIVENQLNIINCLNKLDIDVSINVVAHNDVISLENTIIYLLKLKPQYKFDIVILPNISNKKRFDESSRNIYSLCKKYNLVEKKTYNVIGTSNTVNKFTSSKIGNIYIKTTKHTGKPYVLSSMCNKCDIKDDCQEGFYGIRVEKIHDIIHVRLCLHRTSKDVVMTFSEFENSLQYREIKAL